MMVLPVSVSPAERRRARELAELLEGSQSPAGHELESLVALARSLVPAQFVPRAGFRTALRESLVAEAAARPPADAPARARAATLPRRHRVRTIVASGVLVSLLGGVAAAAASTHAVPGDALYGLKRDIESARLEFAHSHLSRGRELLDQANHRLSEAETLAASENARTAATTARIAATLTDLTIDTRAATTELENAYADTGDVEALVELQRFVANQQERLADLRTLLTPDLQAMIDPLSALLGTLQARLATLAAGAPSAPVPSGAARSAGTGFDPSVTDPLHRLTGATPSTAARPGGVAGTGGLGHGGAASTLPSAVPRVSVPVPGLTSLPVPTPSLLPVPPPVQVTPPCVPIPPLTTC